MAISAPPDSVYPVLIPPKTLFLATGNVYEDPGALLVIVKVPLENDRPIPVPLAIVNVVELSFKVVFPTLTGLQVFSVEYPWPVTQL